MKTAELFALSCDLGACLSGATAAQRAALRAFGMALGTAYQIYDDCLDLFGSEAAVGKSLGTDLAKGKLTLPVLRFWERADVKEKARFQEMVANWKPHFVGPALELLAKYDALAESTAIIHQYLRQATQLLEKLPPAVGNGGLAGLTQYLARQTDALGGCA